MNKLGKRATLVQPTEKLNKVLLQKARLEIHD